MITYHPPLIVPRARARYWISVARQRYYWQEGKAFVFDGARKHEVLNATEETRVILLVQFAHPLSFLSKLLSSAFLGAVRYSPFIGGVMRKDTYPRTA